MSRTKKKPVKIVNAWSATICEWSDGTLEFRIAGRWYATKGGDELRPPPASKVEGLRRKLAFTSLYTTKVWQ